MRAFELFKKLTLYYLVLAGLCAAVFYAVPDIKDFMPIGGAQSLLIGTSDDPFEAIEVGRTATGSLGGSLVWMFAASILSIVLSVPVAWTYIASRKRDEFDNSIIRSIIILPILLTNIVLIVHNSLALAFSLAGIVGAVRFRNTLKSPGDALYILTAIGIGLSAGIGAIEVAVLMTIIVNYAYLVLWVTEFGVEKGSIRYMRHPYEKKHAEQDIVKDETAAE